MRLRVDGMETRRRILQAAGEVFAARGYRDATVAEICRRAKANSAAINYHFNDKESLYVEVWRQSATDAMRLYPFDGGIPTEAPVQERLRGFLVATLKRMTDRGRLGMFHQLRLMEMANPTGLIDRVRWQAIQPMRVHVHRLLTELLGSGTSEPELTYCELNLLGPCLMAQMTCQHNVRGIDGGQSLDVESFADHCTEFLLAGIKAIRDRRKAKR